MREGLLSMRNIECPECGVAVVGPDEGGIEMQCGSCSKLFLTPTPIAKPVDLSPSTHSPDPFSPVSHTTIELTSKRLKLYEIGCLLIMVLGMVMSLWKPIESRNLSYFAEGFVSKSGILLFAVGLVGFIAVRIRIYWHHG